MPTYPDSETPDLLLRESQGGWACYGAVPVRDLIRRMESHAVAEVVVFGAGRGAVIGVLTRSDLRHLTRGRARAPLRKIELDWLVRGTLLRFDGDREWDSDVRAVLLLGGVPARARPGASLRNHRVGVIPLRKTAGS